MKQLKVEKPKRKKVIQKPKPIVSKTDISGKDQFLANRGLHARINGKVGIICGYTDKALIMAVTIGQGWLYTSHEDAVIVNFQKNSRGYEYTDVEHIIG